MGATSFARGQQFTADGVVGVSGVATALWSITNHRGTSVTIAVYDGIDATGTLKWGPITAESSANRTYKFPNGLFCPAGAFIDIEGTTPQASVTYTQ